MRTKIITLILIVTLVLTREVEAFTLIQKLGSEYIETTVEKDEQVRMVFTSKDGFRFKNWVLLEGNISINVNSNDITFEMPNENVTIEAEYDTTYQITFNSNDGTNSITTMSIVAGRTEKLIKNTFERDGYRFTGWSTEQDNTVEYQDEADCTPSSNLMLYAVWELAEVTVEFVTNGGSAVNDMTVIYGETYGTLPTTSKTGYTFDGWYKEDDTLVTNETEVTEATTHTLYAKWTINTYTVVYNANGGSGSMSNSTFTYDTSQTLRKNSFTRDNSTFLGWSKSKNGTSATYTDGQSVKNLATNGTVTLYAVWAGTLELFENWTRYSECVYFKYQPSATTCSFGVNPSTYTLWGVLGSWDNWSCEFVSLSPAATNCDMFSLNVSSFSSKSDVFAAPLGSGSCVKRGDNSWGVTKYVGSDVSFWAYCSTYKMGKWKGNGFSTDSGGADFYPVIKIDLTSKFIMRGGTRSNPHVIIQ